MNWLDFVLMVLLGISIFSGYRTGIIRGFFSLAGWVLGIVLGTRYYVSLGQLLSFMPQKAAQMLAFALITTAVVLMMVLIAGLLIKVTATVMPEVVNRTGGAVFGLVTGALTCSVLLALWIKFAGPQDAVTHSSISAILLSNFDKALSLLPDEQGVIRSFFR